MQRCGRLVRFLSRVSVRPACSSSFTHQSQPSIRDGRGLFHLALSIWRSSQSVPSDLSLAHLASLSRTDRGLASLRFSGASGGRPLGRFCSVISCLCTPHESRALKSQAQATEPGCTKPCGRACRHFGRCGEPLCLRGLANLEQSPSLSLAPCVESLISHAKRQFVKRHLVGGCTVCILPSAKTDQGFLQLLGGVFAHFAFLVAG